LVPLAAGSQNFPASDESAAASSATVTKCRSSSRRSSSASPAAHVPGWCRSSSRCSARSLCPAVIGVHLRSSVANPASCESIVRA
jgi:hypothetical protein